MGREVKMRKCSEQVKSVEKEKKEKKASESRTSVSFRDSR